MSPAAISEVGLRLSSAPIAIAGNIVLLDYVRQQAVVFLVIDRHEADGEVKQITRRSWPVLTRSAPAAVDIQVVVFIVPAHAWVSSCSCVQLPRAS